jgi:hypothetical protein
MACTITKWHFSISLEKEIEQRKVLPVLEGMGNRGGERYSTLDIP